MTDNELLLAISEIMDKKIAPVEHRLKSIELTLENNIIPKLHTSTYDRYKSSVESYESMQADIQLLKNVVTEHSEKLKKIS